MGRKKSVCHELCLFSNVNAISNIHCRLYLELDENQMYAVYLEDHSSNGTFLNGKKLGKGNKAKVRNEDVISLLPGKKDTKKKNQDSNSFFFPKFFPFFNELLIFFFILF